MNSCSVADATDVNPNGIKKLLVNSLWTFPIKGNPVFNNGPKSLHKLPDCTILCNWVFDNFILDEELFAGVLWNFETYVLVNNNFCGKLFSSSNLRQYFMKYLKLL